MPVSAYSVADSYVISHARNTEHLTHDEFVALFMRYNETTDTSEKIEIQNIIVSSYLQYAIHIANIYSNRGVPTNDLISEATLGLIVALKKYSLEWNTKFHTYAENWMRHYCRLAVAHQTRTVRLPIYVVRLLYKFNKCKAELYKNIGYEPSNEDVFDYAEFKERDISALNHVLHQSTESIDDKKNKDDQNYSDIIPDYRCKEGIDEAAEKEQKNRLDKIISELNDKEQKVILYRKNGETIRDIAVKLGISFQRVAQIEKEAHTKIRKVYN